MHVANPAWIASVKLMRVLCPLGVAGATIVGYFDWIYGGPLGLALMAYCGGINTVLTWVQWYVFEINPRRRA